MIKPGNSNALCLKCGLCCNGVIFADVQLQSGDDAGRLRSLGLAVGSKTGSGSFRPGSNQPSRIERPTFSQPCNVLDGCRCRVYADRPRYCGEFECLVLKDVKAGHLDAAAGLRVIRAARRRAEEVRRLLRRLGDDNEQLALSQRFLRMKRRLESGAADCKAAGIFSRLTLAVHDLNVLLSEAFYPGVPVE